MHPAVSRFPLEGPMNFKRALSLLLPALCLAVRLPAASASPAAREATEASKPDKEQKPRKQRSEPKDAGQKKDEKDKKPAWDVSKPPGEWKEVSIDTEEATWSDVDV